MFVALAAQLCHIQIITVSDDAYLLHVSCLYVHCITASAWLTIDELMRAVRAVGSMGGAQHVQVRDDERERGGA